MRTVPRLEWASAYGALHGGAVGLFIHRAIHYAIGSIMAPEATHHGVSLAISYLRPAVCGDEPVECVGTVIGTSKRFVHSEGQLIMPSGKVAARVQAVHAITPS